MPHMRKQEILQNYKTPPITALQTHKTVKKTHLGCDADFSCVTGTRTIISFIYMLFYLNRPTNRYCLLKTQALQNTHCCDLYFHYMNYFSTQLAYIYCIFISAATIFPSIPTLFSSYLLSSLITCWKVFGFSLHACCFWSLQAPVGSGGAAKEA